MWTCMVCGKEFEGECDKRELVDGVMTDACICDECATEHDENERILRENNAQ